MVDTLFFIASKVVWAVIRPEALFLLLILVAYFALRQGAVRAARRVLGVTLLIGAALAFLPLGHFVLQPLETRFRVNPPLDDPAGIIVLGGSERADLSSHWGQPLTNEAGERFQTATALARAHPDARLVFSGGSGALKLNIVSEATVATRIFSDAGIDPSRVTVEGRSRNTAENVAFTLELLGDPGPGPWVIVTSAFHMPRAVGVFCAAGWTNVIPYPTDFRSGKFGSRIGMRFAEHLDELNRGSKEWVGLVVYWLTGRTSALFPDGCER